MKFFYSVTLLILTTFGFSQEYQFNLLTKYNIKAKKYENERIIYSNDSDSSYFLLIKKTPTENLAYIFDLKNKKEHCLSFNEIKSKDEVFFTFNYLNTKRLTPFDVNQNVVVEFETIKQDSLYKTVKMTTYENKRKKKVLENQQLIVRNHSKKLFPLFRYSCMHTLEFRSEINFDETGIVESSTSEVNKYWKTTLDYYKEIALTLKIPNK